MPAKEGTNCFFSPAFPSHSFKKTNEKKMKRIAFSLIVILCNSFVRGQEGQAEKDSFYSLTPVEVKAVRATNELRSPRQIFQRKKFKRKTWPRPSRSCLIKHHR